MIETDIHINEYYYIDEELLASGRNDKLTFKTERKLGELFGAGDLIIEKITVMCLAQTTLYAR